jgi:acyl-CoA synthetase (AMP-forming)/AMP-acid ligase II
LDHLQNIGLALTETAQRLPDQIAVACPARPRPTKLKVLPGQTLEYSKITFAQLERRTNAIAAQLQASRVQAGMRVALMVPPGIDFVAHVFALYKVGAVSILIDPGMGRKNLVGCLSAARPQALVGIRKAHLARWVFRSKLKECRINICTDGWFPGCQRTDSIDANSNDAYEPAKVNRESPAAIIFTTGSTGPPKGVLYRQRNFIEQAQQIRDYFDIQPGGADVSGFPLFALFNTAMGITTVFPAMDATKPAEIYPPNLIDAATQFNATQSFGSPALWNTVSNYCNKHGLRLPTVKSVYTAGAPVPPNVLQNVKAVIADDGDVYTPYGATEALPVACNSASVVLGETAAMTRDGRGTCVGTRFSQIDWRVIEISDSPLAKIELATELAPGQIGELIVSGPVVTDQYVTRTEANAEHKIIDGDSFWHRMGDVGYLDDQNRFWFCGRKGHRVLTKNETLYTVPCEAIANVHPQVHRSALVGMGAFGSQIPVMIVEPQPEHWPATLAGQKEIVDAIQKLLADHPQTQTITHVLLRQKLPVDIRHNSKIFREQLKPWAEEQLRAQP